MQLDPLLVGEIRELEEALGIKLYLVGGVVRDLLLGHTPKDYDFITPALPEIVELAIRKIGKKPYTLGRKFGTLGFKYALDGKNQIIEITTFRTEKYNNEIRKPDIEFTDKLELDLGRRDFTINAMAVDSKGELIDIFGGQQDLESRIIRAVGNPKIKFQEDPLRLLRAIRLAGQLDFAIEAQTFEKIREVKFSLYSISKERWVGEMDLILIQQNIRKSLNMLMDSGLLGVMIPEMTAQKNYDQNTPYHDFTLWEHTLNVVEGVPQDNLELRWTALLHDIAKPFTRIEKPNGFSGYHGHELVGSEMVQKVGTYLKFSKARIQFIQQTIKHHLRPESPLKQYDDGGKKVISTTV